ncbi:hypothetical protein BDV96DRAFT_649197 [Lophiotrema nucula]|uniref:Uncharacterized protein n=1 Tax=Lophiotrema nucula TaxID=690887 RepID=A0A6A5Z1Y3_9PLEO|nr:hypothetical protein BDV96DRAFT_649197 [Lophiotrema nucula]
MAPNSQASSADWGRYEARFSHTLREDNSSPPAPTGRVGSVDVRHVGGHLPYAPEPESPNLDPSDLVSGPEDANEQHAAHQNYSYYGSPSRSGTPSSYNETTAPQPPHRYRHIPGGPYLSPDEYEIFRSRRNPSPSSGHSSREYITAQGSPQSVTTFDAEEGEDIARNTTPYFTPSHTPSHHSLETDDLDEEEHEGHILRVPESPSPWSPHHHHQSHIAQGAVDEYDNRFTGH